MNYDHQQKGGLIFILIILVALVGGGYWYYKANPDSPIVKYIKKSTGAIDAANKARDTLNERTRDYENQIDSIN